jgi:prolyl-tRNA synthetase
MLLRHSASAPRALAWAAPCPLLTGTRFALPGQGTPVSPSVARRPARHVASAPPAASGAKQSNQQRQRQDQRNSSSPASSSSSLGSTASTPADPPTRADDYSRWYQYVIASADLAEASPVKGCMVIKPHGYAVWEALRDELDARIKASGAKNAYFPLLIPQSFLSKEAAHVEGFAKECALVTHHRLRAVPGGEAGELEPDPEAKLEEPLVVRPTSETIVWHMFGKWIQSYRELPLMINQWANVVRWEMRTRPFLRTAEFLWQEGHTAHATAPEAEAKAREMIDVYAEVAEKMLAIPCVKGVKSPSERFAGAAETYTIEAMMQNGWALQAGTSHFLGQSFAKAFDVTFKNDRGEEELVWATSWGVTTRLIGALIMTHSDDTGLVLPPSVAPIQVALVCIFKTAEQKAAVMEFAAPVADRLRAVGVSVVVDDRENMRPGAKYFEWERKGVPLRMEVGPKDAAKGAVFAARRVGGQKVSMPVDDGFEAATRAALDSVQDGMLAAARARLDSRTRRVDSYDGMKAALLKNGGRASDGDAGFFLAPWRCDAANERAVKEETKATLRCYPLELQGEATGRLCFYSGEPATHMAIFARAY